MKLQHPFVQLPLSFDAAALAAEIDRLGEAAWKHHPQGFAGNSMLPLVAVDGDPANEAFAGRMQPTAALDACPYLRQVVARLGATVGRSRLMRLAGEAEVTRHVDRGYYWAERVRVHVPIVTQPTVRFECGSAAINMAAGDCWIFDTWRQHRVLNDAREARIHLVVDTVGGGSFWDLVARGRNSDGRCAVAWQVDHVAPEGGEHPFACETVNVPTVMTPWELATHLGFLFGEAVPHPALQVLQQLAGQLMREWRALWAEVGDDPDGRVRYRRLFDAFAAAARTPGEQVQLRNELGFHDVLLVLIGKAVVDDASAAGAGASLQRALGDNA